MKPILFTSGTFSILDEPTVMEIDVEFSFLSRREYSFKTWIFDPDLERYRTIEEFPVSEQMQINALAADWASKNAMSAYEDLELSHGDREYEAWRDRQMEERS